MAFQHKKDDTERVEARPVAIDAETGSESAGDELNYSVRGRGAKRGAPVFENSPGLDETYFDEGEAGEDEQPAPDGAEDAEAESGADGAEAGEGGAPRDSGKAGTRRKAGRKAPARKAQKSREPAQADRKHSRRGAVTGAVVAFTALALMAVIALEITGGGALISGPLGAVMAPIQGAVNAVTDTVSSKLDALGSNEQLARELDKALQELAVVNIKTARYDEVVAENERLRSLMGSYDKYSQYEPKFARVIGKDTGNWFATFTVDKGSSGGVTENMTVMSADGVVGRVVEVGLNYAKVMSIIDGSSGVAALIERNRDNGVVRGMVDDTTSEHLLQMNYLPDVNDVRTGDNVLTSGLDGIFPKGLPIGTVTQISRQSSGLAQYVVVTPYTDFEHIEEVILLKPQN